MSTPPFLNGSPAIPNAAMVRELGHGGSQCDFGARLLEVVEGLGEGHFRCLTATPPGA